MAYDDLTDIRAFRLYMLVQWGHNPKVVMEDMPEGYRLFLFGCVDAWMLMQQASSKRGGGGSPPQVSMMR